MTVTQQLVVYLGLLACGLGTAGLVLRGEWRIARTLTAYLGFMFGAWLLIMAWPARFWTWEFWLLKQTAYDVLEIAVAFELAHWILMGFPGAARTVRAATLAILAATFVAVVLLPYEETYSGALTLASYLRPRLDLGKAWLYLALLLFSWRYRIPMYPLHFAVLCGMVVNICLFGLFVHAMGVLGLYWATGEPLVTLSPAAFTGVCFWWAWRAWRPSPVPEASPGMVEILQPWRVR